MRYRAIKHGVPGMTQKVGLSTSERSIVSTSTFQHYNIFMFYVYYFTYVKRRSEMKMKRIYSCTNTWAVNKRAAHRSASTFGLAAHRSASSAAATAAAVVAAFCATAPPWGHAEKCRVAAATAAAVAAARGARARHPLLGTAIVVAVLTRSFPTSCFNGSLIEFQW